MSAKPYGGRVVVGLAPQSLTALIRQLHPDFTGSSFGAGALRADELNTEKVSILNVGGDLLGYLRPAEPLDMTNLGSVLQTDLFFLKGDNAGDAVYCFLVEW